MGICGSVPAEDAEAKKRSHAIDRALAEDQQRLRRECKILLLGMLIFVIFELELKRSHLYACDASADLF